MRATRQNPQTAHRKSVRTAVRAAGLCAALLGGAVLAHPAAAGGLYEPQPFARSFTVGIDQMTSLQLNEPAAIVAVGNPSIADAQVQSRTLLLLVGRTFGATNVTAFNADGEEIASFVVNVVDAAPRAVTVMRGAQQRTYNCAPQCERVFKIGDAEAKDINEQGTAKMGMATAGAGASAGGR